MNTVRIQDAEHALTILLSGESDIEHVEAACEYLRGVVADNARLREVVAELRNDICQANPDGGLGGELPHELRMPPSTAKALIRRLTAASPNQPDVVWEDTETYSEAYIDLWKLTAFDLYSERGCSASVHRGGTPKSEGASVWCQDRDSAKRTAVGLWRILRDLSHRKVGA